jgi:hypothetical protein
MSQTGQDSTSQKNDTLLKSKQIDSTGGALNAQNLDNLTSEQKRLQNELENLKSAIKTKTKDHDKLKSDIINLENAKTALDNRIKKFRFDSTTMANAAQKDTAVLKQNKATIDSLSDALKTIGKSIQRDSTTLIAFQKHLESFLNDSLDLIATIEIRDTAGGTQAYSMRKGGKNKKVNITHIHLIINEGLITDIQVETNIGSFRNKQAPIDLTRINETRGQDKLELEMADGDNLYMHVADAIRYVTKHTYRDIPYIHQDLNLYPTPEKYIALIKESTSINSYFEAGTFTDLLGIAGSPNALVEANAGLKFIVNTRNFNNRPLIPFNYVKIVGSFSKFDGKFKGTVFGNADSVSRIDLVQRAKDKIGIKLNLLHWVPSPYPKRLVDDMELNFGFNFIGASTLRLDTLDAAKKIVDSVYKRVVHNQFYLEPMINISRNSAIGALISAPIYYQNVKGNSGIKNTEWRWYFAPSLMLYYSSKKSPNNKLYFKYTNYSDLKDSKFGFSQAQIGYSANFSDLFKLSK